MQGFKGVVVVATIFAAAITLGACRKEVAHDPVYKLGAPEVSIVR